MQRASSDLKLNPHLHAVFLDGVYVPGADAAPEFRALPRLSTTDVADALQVTRARILRYLEQRRVITLDSDADRNVLTVCEELAERDPALSQLAAAAVSGLAPAGPELRRKARELAFAGRPGVVIDAPLSVRFLSANQPASGGAPDFRQGREGHAVGQRPQSPLRAVAAPHAVDVVDGLGSATETRLAVWRPLRPRAIAFASRS